ncbi:MAG: VOC family protein [Armatimonadota bacterium]|nr:VOC family protein [Armatimonadota bacterium]MDR7401149.1 VOC family protein [Armatimonadota bacterium]MDR7403431.1 VOC family protein [Armatimonadota bacterium]MDR7436445.1 VOC family protein [Armatimonadota bacterium]MDR7471804.1 VOC family protein [Armatimonadota bacterium]
MSADCVEYVYLETHHWEESLAFWQRLGFRLALNLGRAGRLEAPAGGTAIFLEEVPGHHSLTMEVYLRAPEEFEPSGPVQVVQRWHDSHWGTRLMQIRDPDGRTFTVQVQPRKGGSQT